MTPKLLVVVLLAALALLTACSGESAGEAEQAHDHEHEREHSADEHGLEQGSAEAGQAGRTVIADEQAKAAGIETALAGPGVLRDALSLYGSIQPNAERVRNVVARFPGVIKSVGCKVGDTVRAGAVLATVESNESLQVYAVTAPIAGVVTARQANPGEAAGTEPLFVLADFSSVWAELNVFPRDHGRLRPGQQVSVQATDGPQTGTGMLSYVSPAGGAAQNLTARVVLDNSQGHWIPGLFVTGEVTIAATEVPLVVAASALQTLGDATVVFEQSGDSYQARALELGRNDGEQVEVLGGLAPGTRYVTRNSYVIKADIEKAGAAHEH